MDVELLIATGAVVMFLSVPSLVSAWYDRRFPLVAVVVIVLGFALIVIGAVGLRGSAPGATGAAMRFITGDLPRAFGMIPHAIYDVVGRVISYFH